MQRLRIRFGRGEEIKYISHLDIMRLWERALRRAEIPLAYTEGFNPHPRLSLAVPLPLGVTSDSELMDIFVSQPLSPHWFISITRQQLPPGMDILEARQIALTLPSLQSQVRYAEYRVLVETEKEPEEIEESISNLLALEHLPWHHYRDTGRRDYDLRVLIDDLWLIEHCPPYSSVGMRLRCDSAGSGRPEQVAHALGFTNPPQSIHRIKLILKN